MTTNAAEAPKQGTFTGHPKGLYLLFFTEMWERFCYYGMRALLALYVAEQFTNGDQGAASKKYGAFTALVYATGVFGGAIADRLLGYQRAIMLGGLFIAAGEFMLMVPKGIEGSMPFNQEQGFLFGLALMIIGNGLFKPNISTVVGKLYKQGDPRRDQGFTIFYMGINLGALLAPFVCGSLRQAVGFRWGFAAAGACMLLGILNFSIGRKRLGDHGKPPAGKEGMGLTSIVTFGGLVAAFVCYKLLSETIVLKVSLYGLMAVVVLYILWIGAKSDLIQRQRLWALVVLLFANSLFWALFEQAGNSFTFFAENMVDRQTPFGTFEATWFQSVNAGFIVLLAPVFVMIWAALDRRKANPTIPAKFGLALIQNGLSFGVLVLGIRLAPDNPAAKAGFIWLWITYLLQTMGELCLSPVGLSMVTKLAPEKMVGFVMGAWFISISVGNYLAGEISAAVGGEGAKMESIGLADYAHVFMPAMQYCVAAGVLVLLVSKVLNRWMHGVK